MKLKDFLDYNEKKIIKPIHYHLNFAPAIKDVDQDICDYFEAHYTEKKLKDFYKNNSGLIKTPFRSEKSGLDILISVYRKRDQEKFMIGTVHATKFTYFAVRRMQAFYDLKKMIGSDKHPNQLFNDFENFFENGCLADTLEQLNNHDGNIVLPTNFKKDDNRVMAIFRDNSDPFPKKFLSHFRVVATDEKSELGKFAILYGDVLEDLKGSLNTVYGTKELAELIQDFFEELSQDEVPDIKKTIETCGAYFLLGIPLTTHSGNSIDLHFEPNNWRPLEYFDSVPIPQYYVLFRENRYSKSLSSRENFSSHIEYDSERFKELAILMGNKHNPDDLLKDFKEDIDNRYDKNILNEAIEEPLYLDTCFKSVNHFPIKARIHTLTHKTPKIIYRFVGFTTIPEDSALNKFAICYTDRFLDLQEMIGDGSDADELINKYIEDFERKHSHKFSFNPDDYSDEEIKSLKTCFETGFGKVYAYFDRCTYYNKKKTPFYLQYFYVRDFDANRPETDDTDLAKGLRELYYGDDVHKIRRPRPDPIIARRSIKKSRAYESQKTILEYLILTQKSRIVKEGERREAQEKERRKESELREEKERLIQQYSHALGSSIGIIEGGIKSATESGDTEGLKNVLYKIDSISKDLSLLSFSARNPEQLQKEIIESLVESGYGLSEILFDSVISSLSLILHNSDYKRHILVRYLANIGSRKNQYSEHFYALDKDVKNNLLKTWKQRKFHRNEEQRKKTDAKTWETLSESEFNVIYHNWLKNELSQEFEEIQQRRTKSDLIQWINHIFMRTEFDIESEICFESAESRGVNYFSWIFSEICLNCFKYGKSGEIFHVSFRQSKEKYQMRFANKITEKPVFGPGSRSGLKVLRILVENLQGKFQFGKRELNDMFEVFMEIPIRKGSN